MKETNKYGFVSGGYIFDTLDKGSLDFINKYQPSTDDQYWFTANAEISYLKQLCNLDNIDINYYISSHVFVDEITVRATMYQGQTEIAEGKFVFRKTSHNYCNTRGQK